MRTVLGIDAAWTAHNPSGVALVEETTRRWRLAAVAPSYARFHALGGPQIDAVQLRQARPDLPALLDACHRLTGRAPDLIAVDMPLSRLPIVGRRESDRQVSRAYGARKCATHSPSALRPGKISDHLREACEQNGYRLWTGAEPPPPRMRCLIEIYPHPALVELTGAPERLKYKAGKIGNYWSDLSPTGRKVRLFGVWRSIVTALETEITGAEAMLPKFAQSDRGAAFKAFEDAMDAIICAWVGVQVLEGRAKAYGDLDSAIWIPCRN
jgi:predicted RNase H-like nuclease